MVCVWPGVGARGFEPPTSWIVVNILERIQFWVLIPHLLWFLKVIIFMKCRLFRLVAEGITRLLLYFMVHPLFVVDNSKTRRLTCFSFNRPVSGKPQLASQVESQIFKMLPPHFTKITVKDSILFVSNI